MFYIIKQGIRCSLRQRKWILFNMFFPIFLMLLVGTILSSTFKESNITIDKINISYFDSGTEDVKNIFEVLKNSDNDFELEFKKVNNIEEGKDNVRKERHIFVYLDNEKIKVYYSDYSTKLGGIILSNLRVITKGNNTVTELYRVNAVKAREIIENNPYYEEVKVETISQDKAPNSYQYYGVVEVSMMSLYVALFPLGLMAYDKRKDMKSRINLAGISDFTYYSSRIISSWMLSVIISLPGFLFSIFALNTNWGEYPIITFIYFSALTFMIVTLGTVVGAIMKQADKASMVLQSVIIPIISFLGGAYIAIPDDLNGIFSIVSYLSPLRWFNKGVFKLAYSGDWTFLNTSLAISIVGTVILIGILTIVCKKEEKRL